MLEERVMCHEARCILVPDDTSLPFVYVKRVIVVEYEIGQIILLFYTCQALIDLV